METINKVEKIFAESDICDECKYFHWGVGGDDPCECQIISSGDIDPAECPGLDDD